MQPLANIHGPPIEGHGPPLDQRQRGKIKSEPGQERVTPPISPDLETRRRPGAEAAGVKAHRIGHYQGVLGHRENSRFAETEASQILNEIRNEPRAD